MIVVRYYALVALYHLITFYKQKPIAFIIGTLLLPYHFLSSYLYSPELHKEAVSNGVNALKSYWQVEGAIHPPLFLRRRFEALGREVLR